MLTKKSCPQNPLPVRLTISDALRQELFNSSQDMPCLYHHYSHKPTIPINLRSKRSLCMEQGTTSMIGTLDMHDEYLHSAASKF
jgi:hypothetical protein